MIGKLNARHASFPSRNTVVRISMASSNGDSPDESCWKVTRLTPLLRTGYEYDNITGATRRSRLAEDASSSEMLSRNNFSSGQDVDLPCVTRIRVMKTESLHVIAHLLRSGRTLAATAPATMYLSICLAVDSIRSTCTVVHQPPPRSIGPKTSPQDDAIGTSCGRPTRWSRPASRSPRMHNKHGVPRSTQELQFQQLL